MDISCLEEMRWTPSEMD